MVWPLCGLFEGLSQHVNDNAVRAMQTGAAEEKHQQTVEPVEDDDCLLKAKWPHIHVTKKKHSMSNGAMWRALGQFWDVVVSNKYAETLNVYKYLCFQLIINITTVSLA